MRTGVVDWAEKSRSLPGLTECGDRCVVTQVTGGVLIAVIDGLGHGHEAARAADCAAVTIQDNADRSFSSLLLHCHNVLKKTRGAVLSLAFLDNNRGMTWMGVGNVEGRLIRRHVKYVEKSESLLLRTGVVGGDCDQLPTFYPTGVSIIRGDLLVMATDGISRDFESDIDTAADPASIADDIIRRHSRSNDDALVFVGRYIG